MTRAPAKTAWVTGASSGIGAALTAALVEDGWFVITSSRRRLPSALRSALRGRTADVPMDVADPGSVGKAWSRIRSLRRPIDLLVNNAGVTVFREFMRTRPSDVRSIIATNLEGLFHTTRLVIPVMRRRRNGLVLNILSMAARRVYTRSAAYGASKAGASMMMRVLREELRGSGVAVVNVYPGPVETPMWPSSVRRRGRSGMMPPADAARAVADLVRMPALAIPEEVELRPPGGDLTV